MKILHPNNNNYLPIEDLKNYYNNGFYTIIDYNEEKKLNYFLDSLENFRRKEKILDISLYPNLPFSIQTNEWKEKQKDIKIIDQIIGKKMELSILDVGCWNGWLCNYLSIKGHKLVGVDIFKDEFDGLQANKYYKTNFVLLQMNTNELQRIKQKFDLIIFNRNWAYYNHHQEVFEKAKKLLSKDGIILFTGLTIYKNPKNIITYLKKIDGLFREKYNTPFLFVNTKGFLESNDKKMLLKNNVKLVSYDPIKNYLKGLINTKRRIYYGIFQNNVKTLK